MKMSCHEQRASNDSPCLDSSCWIELLALVLENDDGRLALWQAVLFSVSPDKSFGFVPRELDPPGLDVQDGKGLAFGPLALQAGPLDGPLGLGHVVLGKSRLVEDGLPLVVIQI